MVGRASRSPAADDAGGLSVVPSAPERAVRSRTPLRHSAGRRRPVVADQQAAGLKGWTIKGQLTVLSAVYKHASRHLGYVGTSPVTLLDRFERPSSEDERPKRVLTPDELRVPQAGARLRLWRGSGATPVRA